MKKIFPLLLLAISFGSCALQSRTIIGPKKTFDLGDGKHGFFKAIVKNDCEVAIDVYETSLGGSEKKILTLNPGQQKTVRFAADTKASFKNTSNKEAAVKLKVTGDTGLSMGGPNY